MTRLDEDNLRCGICLDYIKRMIGLPYLWGGDDTIAGFDCSGLVVEYLQCSGQLKENEDLKAHGLMRRYFDKRVILPETGCLVFFGKNDHATHVGICLNNDLMIEAGGGGSKTQTKKDAVNQNAFIRVRPINNRSDFLCFVDPFKI